MLFCACQWGLNANNNFTSYLKIMACAATTYFYLNRSEKHFGQIIHCEEQNFILLATRFSWYKKSLWNWSHWILSTVQQTYSWDFVLNGHLKPGVILCYHCFYIFLGLVICSSRHSIPHVWHVVVGPAEFQTKTVDNILKLA